MKFFCPEAGIDVKKKLTSLQKEFFRKTIHICTAFVPIFLHFARIPVIVILCIMGVLYTIAELFRLNGVEIPLVSDITAAAARKRDENKFVLGPITLVCGIILSAVLWTEMSARVGILALAFGDGLASLAGKTFGRVRIPFTQGKTAAGSLTCFAAIFCSAFFVMHNTLIALVVACAGAFVEVLPLKDFDNLLIPVMLGGLVTFSPVLFA